MTSTEETFEEAWARKEAEGYRYGRDALENVRFGWEIRQESERLRACEEPDDPMQVAHDVLGVALGESAPRGLVARATAAAEKIASLEYDLSGERQARRYEEQAKQVAQLLKESDEHLRESYEAVEHIMNLLRKNGGKLTSQLRVVRDDNDRETIVEGAPISFEVIPYEQGETFVMVGPIEGVPPSAAGDEVFRLNLIVSQHTRDHVRLRREAAGIFGLGEV